MYNIYRKIFKFIRNFKNYCWNAKMQYKIFCVLKRGSILKRGNSYKHTMFKKYKYVFCLGKLYTLLKENYKMFCWRIIPLIPITSRIWALNGDLWFLCKNENKSLKILSTSMVKNQHYNNICWLWPKENDQKN